MQIIRLLLKNSGKTFYLATISSFISGASSAGIIATINYGIANLPDLPLWLVWLFISLCLILCLFRFLSWVLITRLSQEVIYDLRLKMTQHILNSPLENLELIGASKLLATLTGDVSTIATASIQLAITIVNLSVLLGVFAYLFWLSPLLFFIIFTSIVVGYSFYRFLEQKGIRDFEEFRVTQDVLFGHFRSLTEGTKELKLHRPRRKAFIDRELKKTAFQAKDYWVKGTTTFCFAGSVGTVLFFIPIGLILFVLPQLDNVSSATISSYTLAVLYTINPITEITTALAPIAQANVSIRKIDSLGFSLRESVTEPDFPDGTGFDENWTSLELIDIHRSYRGEKDQNHQFKLEQINLKFQPGEIVFIVGGNGSGKSTLVKILTGLYTPEGGQILYNNVPITDYNREWYRQQFSVVFYDFYLFDRLLGIEANRESEIQHYLQLLEIEQKITIEDGVLSTTNLSQGQRKRLALLTAYLEDRPIYVFDEWASDQDPVFKRVFYEQLIPQLKSRGKTVIAVSHDDRYFSQCDRLVKLDYGRIISTSRG